MGGLKIIEPQKIGNVYAHVIGQQIDIQVDRARCVSCRKPQLLRMFPQVKMPAKEVSLRVKRSAIPQAVLYAVCRSCYDRQVNSDLTCHPMYTPEIDEFFTRLHRGMKGGGCKRNIQVFVTKDEIMGRYFDNGGRCEISGVMLKPFGERGLKNRVAPSVDRINSDLDYRLDNIQIVARILNVMKNDLDMGVFTTWCKRVAAHQALKEASLLAELESET